MRERERKWKGYPNHNVGNHDVGTYQMLYIIFALSESSKSTGGWRETRLRESKIKRLSSSHGSE